MSRAALVLVVVCCCAPLGCALPGWLRAPAFVGGESSEAQVVVELYQGFASPMDVPATRPERVEILIDATASMETATSAGPGRYVAARNAAARLVQHTAPDSAIGLHALVAGGGDACTPVLRSAGSGAREPRDDLIRRIEGLKPAGEASLAAAVAGVHASLAKDREPVRSRLVIFSDLSGECGGDLCEQLAALVSSGTRVDLVVFGDVAVPRCVDEFDLPGSGRGAGGVASTAYRVERFDGSGRVAVGLTGGRPVAVAAGSVQLVVDLQPPLTVEPVELAPGTTARLRVVDFPALDPPVREWAWEFEPDDAGSDAESGAGDAH